MIIDAKDLIAGRLGSYAAKQALLGEKVDIVNAELAVISGSKKVVYGKYKAQDERGEPFHGPFLPKLPDRFLRRIIRGMLPYKKGKGREAYKRVKCYVGVPPEFEGKTHETVKGANVVKMQNLKYITVKTVCNLLKQR